MKLELKHLAPYLPYKLKGYTADRITFNNGSFISEGKYSLTLGNVSDMNDEGKLHLIKPMLYPLSNLKMNGKGEYHLKQLSDKASKMNMDDIDFDYYCHAQHFTKGYDSLPHWWFQDLIKWHYDVFGLIEKALAKEKQGTPEPLEKTKP